MPGAETLTDMLIHPDEDEGKITTSDIPFQAATVLAGAGWNSNG